MILADKILYLRKKNGWSQEKLAEKIRVSRQAVSKWEGAQSVPDLDKILTMSKLFGVTTDYLLKDEIENEEFIDESDLLTDKQVSLSLAHQYLKWRRKAAKLIALATFLCIIAVIPLLLLSVVVEIPEVSLSSNSAAGLGLLALFVIIAIAVIIFVTCNFKNTPFEFIEKESFITEYGVIGMIKEKQKSFRATYAKFNIIATFLCVLSPIPLFIGIVTENKIFIVLMLTVTIIIVGIGVVLYILAGVEWKSLQKLLKEGKYSQSKNKIRFKKTVSSIYWLTITAVYLGLSFLTQNWKITWIIWPVSGIMYAVVLGLCNLFLDHKSEPKT